MVSRLLEDRYESVMRRVPSINTKALVLALIVGTDSACFGDSPELIRPSDFQPLTALPWGGDSDQASAVVQRIFLEPDVWVRYLVLAEYFRKVPVKFLGEIFDMALRLEGTQTPDDLVALLLDVWAQRDPETAWERTSHLFDLVGLEEGWLTYDGWKDRPRIVLQDRGAIENSGYWLRRETLVAFAEGVNASDSLDTDKVRFMKAFIERWFQHFASWPGHGDATRYRRASLHESSRIISIFDRDPRYQSGIKPGILSQEDLVACEIGWRRWLERFPGDADEILKSIAGVRGPWRQVGAPPGTPLASVSPGLLLVWRRVDRPGLVAWADRDVADDHAEARWAARCLLMAEVPEPQRKRWMAGIAGRDDATGRIGELAAWHPELAMRAAWVAGDELELEDLVDRAVYGPFPDEPWNASLSGIRYLECHGLEHVHESVRSRLDEQWGSTTFMEQWGSINAGSAARFGVKTLVRTDYAPLAEVARFFRGEDLYADEGGLIDRTLCALRVWAATKPAEMRNWIADQDNAQLRKALAWLLEHPWGGSP